MKLADHVWDLSEVVALIDSRIGNNLDKIRQHISSAEGFPYALFVNNSQTPIIFALNPIFFACFWQLSLWQAEIQLVAFPKHHLEF